MHKNRHQKQVCNQLATKNGRTNCLNEMVTQQAAEAKTIHQING